ncbi:hypothetical protein [Xenorhabdus stockiae]|uniref:hypothetical protein n=1 Tax=Xenorhabdus stockiae TaxID=351614 RepID=UPI00147458AB|nr:hypothetical protein [Xenorhabdus stockiae]
MYSTDIPQYLNLRSLWRTDIDQGQGSYFLFCQNGRAPEIACCQTSARGSQ